MALAFNPLDPSFRVDPYAQLHQLRALDPVHFVEEPGLWLLTRYADVVAAFRDPRLSAERFQLSLPEMRSSALISSLSTMMLLRDPPDHTRLRTLVSTAFTPRVVERLRPRIEALVDHLLTVVDVRRSFDLMQVLAAPLPVAVIAQLLGVPLEDHARFKRWSDDLILIADGSTALAGFPQAEQSAGALREYLRVVFMQRRVAPQDDLISGMLAAQEHGDRLSDDELFSTCALLLIAGHETTTNLICNGVLTLLRHPDQLARLRAAPALIESAIEELLRYESPVQLTSRVAKEDFELGGKPVKCGQEVSLMIGAANRDPEQFPDPDRLDLGRADNRHLAFGLGTHFCLGAALARLEGQIAIGAIVQRYPNLHLATDAIEWREGLMIRGVKGLELEV